MCEHHTPTPTQAHELSSYLELILDIAHPFASSWSCLTSLNSQHYVICHCSHHSNEPTQNKVINQLPITKSNRHIFPLPYLFSALSLMFDSPFF